MNKYNYCFIYLFLGVLFLTINSCKNYQNNCLEPQIIEAHFGCYQVAHDTPIRNIDTFLPAPIFIPFNSLQHIQYIGYKKTSKFALTFDPTKDSCQWLIVPDSSNFSIQDTITFKYSRILHFISNACGYTYYYQINAVNYTNFAIDSIKINHSEITNNVNVEHFKIYF